jgi:hypothetical protein
MWMREEILQEVLFLFSPFGFLLLAFIILGVLAWKYRAVYDFLFILLSTAAGFFVGLLRFEYVSIGYAMMCAVAALLISLSIDVGVRLYFKIKKSYT